MSVNELYYEWRKLLQSRSVIIIYNNQIIWMWGTMSVIHVFVNPEWSFPEQYNGANHK